MLVPHLFRHRTEPRWAIRLAGICIATALTAIGARLTIELPWVPITLQVLGVLFAGLALGPKDGAASQVLYIVLIAAGLPIDAGALGPAALLRPSVGYLAGFIAGAYVAGWLALRLPDAALSSLVAAIAGVGVIYAIGTSVLTLVFLAGNWATGFSVGIAPFIAVDIAKAILAAVLARRARSLVALRPPSTPAP